MDGIKLRIADLRKRDGLTQQELAEQLGVTYQSVSKWENGVTMPDITLLPDLARIFGVSVDEILGLKPLAELDYRRTLSGEKGYWSRRLDYLKYSRQFLWNEDYVRFLIREVWKIEKPVRVLDCGCGFGAAGLMMMPYLPSRSTYTGIDFDGELLEEGRRLFQEAGIAGKFVEADVRKWKATRQYDVVVSQAVLRHVDHAEDFVQKMVDAAVDGGLVISIEGNREVECCGLYIGNDGKMSLEGNVSAEGSGLEYAALCENNGLRSLWETEYENQGRDYAAAVKVPGMMRRAGLVDISVRMNDKVTVFPSNISGSDAEENVERNTDEYMDGYMDEYMGGHIDEYIDGYTDEYTDGYMDEYTDEYKDRFTTRKYRDFLVMNGWESRASEEECRERATYFMNHGMSREEAFEYVGRQQRIGEILRNRGNEAEVVYFTGMMISSGRKVGRRSRE